MYGHELMIISAYPEMLEDIQAVCKSLNIKPTIFQWEFAQQELIDKLNEMFLTAPKPDVIISRGATASLIESKIPEIVSIRAEPDNLDLIETLSHSKQYGGKMGVLLYEEYARNYKTEAVRKLLKLQELRLYPFRTKDDIITQVYQGKTDGMDVLVGGGTLGERTGKRCGITVRAVKSSKLTLEKAVRQAESIIYARQQEKLQVKCFSSAAASVQEGILSLENGRIIVANKGIGEILDINETDLPGKLVHELPEDVINAAFLRFLSEESDDDTILTFKGQNYYVRRSIVGEKKRRQTILVFQNTRVIQLQEERVRSALRNSGFKAKYAFQDIVAESHAMNALIDKAKMYATTDANILITGNSGTGKELLAQSIHNASPRRKQPFVAVNCAAIPQALLESELFGYEEGAFSGAKKGGKSGLFELAHKGTIFLDEINSMPIELQSVLLRTIQEKEVRRIGAQKNIFVDIRIIAASNKNLKELIGHGAFRADLFYRLNTLKLSLPDLSERIEDILPLSSYFIRQYSKKYAVAPPALTKEDSNLIMGTRWEGNARELENVMHRFVLLRKMLRTCSIQDCFDQPELDHGRTFSGTLEEIEQAVIHARLGQHGGNKAKTAEELGISRSTLWKKLREKT